MFFGEHEHAHSLSDLHQLTEMYRAQTPFFQENVLEKGSERLHARLHMDPVQNPEKQNPELDKIPNGQNPELDKILNGQNPELDKIQNGQNPELDKIQNRINFKDRESPD